MRRSICQIAGACGLIFTVNAFAQTSGGTAAVGTASAGTAPAAASPSSAARVQAVAPAGTSSSVTQAGAARAGAAPVVQSGQNITVAPGQNLTTASGPTVSATQGTGVVPGQTTAAQQATLNNNNQSAAASASAPGVAAAQTAAPTTGVLPANAVTQPAAFTQLPSSVQAALQTQAATGAQVSGLQQINTSQGTLYRAQVTQNGVATDVFFNSAGAPVSSATVASMLAVPGAAPVGTTTSATTASTTGIFDPLTANLPVAGVAPLAYSALATPIQSAFTAQSGGEPVTDVRFMRTPTGGIYTGMANGQPLQVRVGPNGLPIALAASQPREARDTNAMTLDDLPTAVRDKLRAEMPNAIVTEIRREESPSGDIYRVFWRDEGHLTELQLAENGNIVREATRHEAVVTDTTVTEPVVPKLEWSSLPLAVKDAFEATSAQDKVRAIALTNYQGKTSYAIDYNEDALRHRLFIDKDGRTIGVQTNLHRATTAIASGRRPILIEDLPTAARAAVENTATAATVTRIEMGMRGLDPVYNVQYLEDGETRVMTITPEGARLDAIGSAPAGVIGTSSEPKD